MTKNSTDVLNEDHLLKIFLFKSWPDHDVPTGELLNFIYKFREIRGSNQSNPISVHCSAGVGRSASFVAIDILMRQLAKDLKIDVLQCFHRYVLIVNVEPHPLSAVLLDF